MRWSYHTHTTWSDGEATPAAMLAEAGRTGLAEIGFSDHLTLHPSFPSVNWSLAEDELGPYVGEVLALAAAAPPSGPAVRLGLEADYVPASVGRLRTLLAAHPFDYVIGSVHFVGDFPVDAEASRWEALSPGRRDETWAAYWRAVAEMAGTRLFDIAGHLDLPKKFGHRPSADLTAARDAALDALAVAGMTIELNTSGWSYPAAEAYPAPAILRSARERDIPVVVTADAHRPAHLSRDFDRASRCLREAGYDSVVRFRGRRWSAEPL